MILLRLERSDATAGLTLATRRIWTLAYRRSSLYGQTVRLWRLGPLCLWLWKGEWGYAAHQLN